MLGSFLFERGCVNQLLYCAGCKQMKNYCGKCFTFFMNVLKGKCLCCRKITAWFVNLLWWWILILKEECLQIVGLKELEWKKNFRTNRWIKFWICKIVSKHNMRVTWMCTSIIWLNASCMDYIGFSIWMLFVSYFDN